MPHVSERGATSAGHPRDLADALTMVDRKNLWFVSSVPKGSAPINTLVEWPADNYDAVNTAGVDGDADVTDFEDAFENYGMLSAYIQIHQRKPRVGKIAQKVSKVAGIPHRKVMAAAIAKKLKEIKRDLEATWLSDNETQQGTSSTVPFKTRGLLKWAQSTEHSVLPVPEQFRTPAGSIFSGAALDTLAESDFTDMLRSRYDEMGDPADFTYACGSHNRAHIASFSTYAPDVTGQTVIRQFNGKSNVLDRTVDIVKTEFGIAKLRNSSFINIGGDNTSTLSKAQGIGFDMANLKGHFSEKPNFRELPDMGGGPRGLIESISVLKVMNPMDLIRVNPNALT